MILALNAFDKAHSRQSPNRTEAEDLDARAYCVPLNALYSEVNLRLGSVSGTVRELGRTLGLVDEEGIKNNMATDVAAIPKRCSRTHKTFARCLPALHAEVKRTVEPIRE